MLPPELEHLDFPGYALQEDVYLHFKQPYESLRHFIARFPVQTIRFPVSYNPLRRRNFYPMEAPHRDEPNIPSSRREVNKLKPPQHRIAFKRSYMEHALLDLQSYPQFTLRTLYMHYTKRMPERPPYEHFPNLPQQYLTPDGLKALLRRNRWPL